MFKGYYQFKRFNKENISALNRKEKTNFPNESAYLLITASICGIIMILFLFFRPKVRFWFYTTKRIVKKTQGTFFNPYIQNIKTEEFDPGLLLHRSNVISQGLLERNFIYLSRRFMLTAAQRTITRHSHGVRILFSKHDAYFYGGTLCRQLPVELIEAD